MSTTRIPTYEEFVKMNKEAKRFFAISGHLSDIQNLSNAQAATCTLEYDGRRTKKLSVVTIVLDVYYNGMGILSNPSSIRNWSGWGRTISM